MDAPAWVVPRGVTGPFTSQSTLPADLADRIAGGGQVEPIAMFGHVARVQGKGDIDVTVIGHSIGALGDPVWGRGHVSLPRGQAAVDESLGVQEGATITFGSHTLRVVRTVRDRTIFVGQPIVFVSLAEARSAAGRWPTRCSRERRRAAFPADCTRSPRMTLHAPAHVGAGRRRDCSDHVPVRAGAAAGLRRAEGGGRLARSC